MSKAKKVQLFLFSLLVSLLPAGFVFASGPFTCTSYDSNNNINFCEASYFVTGTSVQVIFHDSGVAGRDYNSTGASTRTMTLCGADNCVTTYNVTPTLTQNGGHTDWVWDATFSTVAVGDYSEVHLHATDISQAGMDLYYGNTNHTTVLFSVTGGGGGGGGFTSGTSTFIGLPLLQFQGTSTPSGSSTIFSGDYIFSTTTQDVLGALTGSAIYFFGIIIFFIGFYIMRNL